MSKPTTSSSSSAAPPLPPIRLKDYEVTEKLGAGSYGNVYKAHGKTGAREVVAIKCVVKSQLSKSETDNLITEISILKKLKHEHIVHMVDFRWDANYIYIIMEYCGGGDLSRFIKSRESLSEDVCRGFLRQLASALRFLRSQDIAHLDLKPSNILLTAGKRPSLKLADFGMAQRFSADETRSSVRGSYLYMAPEILLKSKYDARVDLWSVGVILYECLFGKAPYKSGTLEELLKKVAEERPIVVPRQSHLSKECRDLLVRCLERDPDARITFEDFFTHPFLDLEHFPSEESSKKAASVASRAVEMDRAGNLAEAFKLYKEALDYYVPMLHEEKNSSRKEALRTRITDYVQRAEQIKGQMPSSSSSPSSSNVKSPSPHKLEQRNSVEDSRFREVMELCSMTPRMATGLEIAKAAEGYELDGKYEVALEKYQTSLGLLLPLLSTEPRGPRKTLLHAEVNRWMNRAECVKDLMQAQEKVLADAKLMLAEDPSSSSCEGCGRATPAHDSCETDEGGMLEEGAGKGGKCVWCTWKLKSLIRKKT